MTQYFPYFGITNDATLYLERITAKPYNQFIVNQFFMKSLL